ncbi:MAG TPA: ATP-dependent helicase, partial [Candidatus Nanoarchaeia archaeon]|nr:ATP-dependent helicase [Candidatus Nanoarchaeia archaeon]
MNDLFCSNKKKTEIMEFINSYLYVDENSAQSIFRYFDEQFRFAQIPSHSRIIVEHYTQDKRKFAIFHTLYGRRVNDCLSRAIAFAIAKTQHHDVEIGINDNGFYVASQKPANVMHAFSLLKSQELPKVLDNAIDQSEVLKRRFRHCAARALMILRNYLGREKRVGRQQVSSMILINAVKRISPNFSILREARREVLEDLMDVKNTAKVIEGIEQKKIFVKEINLDMPSPFSFNLVLSGHTDIMKIEDRVEFLKRMHKRVLAKIGNIPE